MAEQCKCGSLDFFMKKQGNNTGLYCSMCGKWQKWMNKDEIRVFEHNNKPRAKNTIKQTNADRIRSMSDEELAEFIEKIRRTCIVDVLGGEMMCEIKADVECKICKMKMGSVLNWLQSEVKGCE